MKIRYSIILILAGMGVGFLGALIKILHLPWSELILIVGGIIETAGWLLFLIRLLRSKKLKELLDE